MDVFMHVRCMRMSLGVYRYMYVRVHACVHVRMYVCLYVCM